MASRPVAPDLPDQVDRPVAGAAAGAVGDRDEARLERAQVLERAEERAPPSSVLGGKNSNEKQGSEGLSRFLIFIACLAAHSSQGAASRALSLDRASGRVE